jgi:hypothetical protein
MRQAALALGVVAGLGCESGPVALIHVEVSTDVAEATWFELRVLSQGGGVVIGRNQRAWAPGTVQSFNLIPRDDDLAASPDAVFEVVAGDRRPVGGQLPTPDGVLVAQRARVRYVAGEVVRLQLILEDRCRPVSCGPALTCRGGTCVSERAAPTADAGAPPTDVGRDVGTEVGRDVGTDARVDAALDVPRDVAPDRVDAGADAGRDVGTDVGTDVVTTICTGGRTSCPGVGCVDLSASSLHCGACGAACPARPNATNTCQGGMCTLSCLPGFGNCNTSAADGCEVDLQNDPASCGTCDLRCASGRCVDGLCVTGCPAGMRLIPTGIFSMGSTMQPSEQPVRRVQLSAFCLDETEVTVFAFAACPTATCGSTPMGGLYNLGTAGRSDHPINGVTWEQAMAYCRTRGATLPTEAQWEYAARGTDDRPYPWGFTPPSNQACWNRYPSPAMTCPVGSLPQGDSPFGIHDMAGNVWEFTLDFTGAYRASDAGVLLDPTGPATGTSHVIRGGSWYQTAATELRASFRNSLPSTTEQNYTVGFRCAHAPL